MCGPRPPNVTDQTRLPLLVEARPTVQGPRGRPRRSPPSEAIIGDCAYGTGEMIAMVESLRIDSLLARRADTTHGSGRGALRYVVERTLACFSHFRRLGLCYKRWGEHFRSFHGLAAARQLEAPAVLKPSLTPVAFEYAVRSKARDLLRPHIASREVAV